MRMISDHPRACGELSVLMRRKFDQVISDHPRACGELFFATFRSSEHTRPSDHPRACGELVWFEPGP